MKKFRFQPPAGVRASFSSIFGRGNNDNDAIRDGLAVDEVDGKPLYRENIISEVLDELEKRKGEKTPLELQWTLNANFLMGNQYCDINVHSGRIEQIPAAYDWLERKSYNRISPLIETRIANLKRINYAMKVNPCTDEMDDYQKAEVSTAILQHMQQQTDFNRTKNTMIHWNELCGNCFLMAWWNKDAGEELVYKELIGLSEDGVEIHEEKAYHEGDIEFGLISPYELYPESTFKQGMEAQRSVILEQVKTVDDVYDLYGITVEGSSAETFELSPLSSPAGYGEEVTVMSIGKRTVENAVKVVTYFERPSKKRPHGRMAIIVGQDKLVYYGALPYERIPIVQVVCKEVAGQFFGRSVIEDLIPLQKAYNGCKNRIHEYIKRIGIQGYAAPEGSINIDEFAEIGLPPGRILEYDPAFGPPTPIPNGVLPNEIILEQNTLVNDMEYVAGVSQMMVTGNTPSGIKSGVAIQNLRDIDDTRLSLTGDNIRNAVKNFGKLALSIYKLYVKNSRVTKYVGSNSIHMAVTWSGEDINSYDVEFTTENELMMSEEMQEARFKEAYSMGLFTDSNGVIPEKFKLLAIQKMKLGQFSDIMSINDLQVQAAQRENTFFEKGIPPEISDFDDHKIHIEEHMRYILQMKYQIMKIKKKEYASGFENHIRMHEEALNAENQKVMALMQGMQGG